MKNKNVLITGATDGIGKETALQLARKGARVLVHGRSEARCQQAVDEIRSQSGSPQVEYVLADFASLAQVRAMAEEVKRRVERLDVLVNNAGGHFKERTLSEDGYEMTLAVNHLAPFLLTNLLLPLLKKSPAGRIVTVSSTLHTVRGLDMDDLQGEQRYRGNAAYALSKLGNILMTRELAERLAGSSVTANSLHPGTVDTKLLRNAFGMSGSSIESGAATSVYLASSPEVAEVSGAYFEHVRQVDAGEQAQDPALQKQFWQISAEWTGLAR
ncbi:MAG: SDR family oxidoreductase [Anaerolineaceae bacterium]|jgi:NAD(P)-dependent dehydrogenase (short-subunit alcohol dehydrogenase family)|nr:SDR family oxidoreductase [Anaerolineaceae bacterium]